MISPWCSEKRIVFFGARSSEKPLLHVHSVLAEALLLIITILGPNFLVLPLLGNFLALKTEGKGSLDNTDQFLISEKRHICQFCFHWLDQSKLHNILSSLSLGCTTVYTKKVFQAVWWRETESECDLCRGVSDKPGLNWASVQFSSVTQSCPTPCDPMNHSMPGLPVHHQLPEFTQTHVHRVGDAIQPSQPLSSPSPPVPNPSQHQSLFQWVNSFHEVAKVSIWVSASASVLPMNTQGWSPLGWTGWIFLQSKGLKSLLQHHSSKASILQHSAFFTVQLSHSSW